MNFTLTGLILVLAATANAASFYLVDGNEVQLVRHARAALPQNLGFGGFGGSASFANANSQSVGAGFGGFPNGAGFGASASQASAGSQSFGAGGFFG